MAKKKAKKNIAKGVVYVAATFNNTVITVTDEMGNVISWSSAGALGFKGSKKSTPFAATEAVADAMSKEAQADRERKARVILGTAETEIAEKFAQASLEYKNNPVALQLRGMNMLFEGLKEKGSMVIVPSSALESMNLGAVSGLVSLAKDNEKK